MMDKFKEVKMGTITLIGAAVYIFIGIIITLAFTMWLFRQDLDGVIARSDIEVGDKVKCISIGGDATLKGIKNKVFIVQAIEGNSIIIYKNKRTLYPIEKFEKVANKRPD